jgi:putative transposase
MPRRDRCILPGVPFHITQRGVDRRTTFHSPDDYLTYLSLVRCNLADAGVRLLAYCLMTNHIHLVAVPEREDSLAVLLRRVHGRYAQYFNTRYGRAGHLWQNRFFACALGHTHLWSALAYVELNPVRAGVVRRVVEYPWSSAPAHRTGTDPIAVLDMRWWRSAAPPRWELTAADEADPLLRRCTYAGRPFGDDVFVAELSKRFGRHWVRGRPRRSVVPVTEACESLPVPLLIS